MRVFPKNRVPERFTLFWMVVVYGLSALGAYQLFSIPLQWMGSALLLLPFFLLLYKGGRYPVIALFPALFLLFMILISLLGWLVWSASIDFPSLLPDGASTSYLVFSFLRYFQLLVFVMAYVLTYSFLKTNGLNRLVNLVVVGGVIASLYAVYVYAGQLFGLPEIPRTRMGTGGEEQSIVFTYAFHRALGSFREPSHLAEWLVLPLFATFWRKSFYNQIARILITFVLFLTGSLTGIVSVFAGYLISVALIFPVHKAMFRIVSFGAIVVLAGMLIFVFAHSYNSGSVNIFGVLLDRLYPVLEGGGLGASNRDYVYEFIATNSIPLLGYGFGNANLLLSDYMGLGLLVSFLNLYLNMLYALGYVGLIVVIVFFAFPLVSLSRTKGADRYQLLTLVGSYIAWLLVYLVHSEELSISFGILYAACTYYYLEYRELSVRQSIDIEASAG